MSAGYRIVSRNCTGTGRSVYEWANSERPGDDGRASCPVCGKRVLVERRTGKMPTHAPPLGSISRIVNITRSGPPMPDTPTPETPAELAALIVRDACELEPADPEASDAISIYTGDLEAILLDRLATLAASSTAPIGEVEELPARSAPNAGGGHQILPATRQVRWLPAMPPSGTLLYAAPAAAERKPLTDEQITAIWSEKPRWHAAPIGETDLEFARAIERAHGITAAPAESEGE